MMGGVYVILINHESFDEYDREIDLDIRQDKHFPLLSSDRHT